MFGTSNDPFLTSAQLLEVVASTNILSSICTGRDRPAERKNVAGPMAMTQIKSLQKQFPSQSGRKLRQVLKVSCIILRQHIL